jgi:hypothetical protein
MTKLEVRGMFCYADRSLTPDTVGRRIRQYRRRTSGPGQPRPLMANQIRLSKRDRRARPDQIRSADRYSDVMRRFIQLQLLLDSTVLLTDNYVLV